MNLIVYLLMPHLHWGTAKILSDVDSVYRRMFDEYTRNGFFVPLSNGHSPMENLRRIVTTPTNIQRTLRRYQEQVIRSFEWDPYQGGASSVAEFIRMSHDEPSSRIDCIAPGEPIPWPRGEIIPNHENVSQIADLSNETISMGRGCLLLGEDSLNDGLLSFVNQQTKASLILVPTELTEDWRRALSPGSRKVVVILSLDDFLDHFSECSPSVEDDTVLVMARSFFKQKKVSHEVSLMERFTESNKFSTIVWIEHQHWTPPHTFEYSRFKSDTKIVTSSDKSHSVYMNDLHHTRRLFRFYNPFDVLFGKPFRVPDNHTLIQFTKILQTRYWYTKKEQPSPITLSLRYVHIFMCESDRWINKHSKSNPDPWLERSMNHAYNKPQVILRIKLPNGDTCMVRCNILSAHSPNAQLNLLPRTIPHSISDVCAIADCPTTKQVLHRQIDDRFLCTMHLQEAQRNGESVSDSHSRGSHYPLGNFQKNFALAEALWLYFYSNQAPPVFGENTPRPLVKKVALITDWFQRDSPADTKKHLEECHPTLAKDREIYVLRGGPLRMSKILKAFRRSESEAVLVIEPKNFPCFADMSFIDACVFGEPRSVNQTFLDRIQPTCTTVDVLFFDETEEARSAAGHMLL